MSSLSVLKYNIQAKPSFIGKRLVMAFFVIFAILLILLWGVSWLSFSILIIYSLVVFSFVKSLQPIPFHCLVAENGSIEINKPYFLLGEISGRSFYNGWVLFLCVEEKSKLLINTEQKHNKSKKWFVVFCDSVSNKEYRLMARLINTGRWG